MNNELFANEYEKSIFILNCTINSLDEMLGRNLFEVLGSPPNQNILFHTAEHQKLFYIYFVDFLSGFDRNIIKSKAPNTPFTNLITIAQSEIIGDYTSTDLFKSLLQLKDWLDKDITTDIWLPSINKKIEINITRLQMIKTCGIISKHNIGKLSITYNEMQKIFSNSNEEIEKDDIILLYEKFYDRFHNDILGYHSSNILEMLNIIRWEIYYYLFPVFKKSYSKIEGGMPGQYSYNFPAEIENKFSKIIFWELMNKIRNKPNLPKFVTTKYLKLRY